MVAIRCRSSHPEVFCQKGLFFNKVAGLKSAALCKKRLWHRCHFVNFEKFLRTPFYITLAVAASVDVRLDSEYAFEAIDKY